MFSNKFKFSLAIHMLSAYKKSTNENEEMETLANTLSHICPYSVRQLSLTCHNSLILGVYYISFRHHKKITINHGMAVDRNVISSSY